MKQPQFLPMSLEEGQDLEIEGFDIIFVSGDAYVDHPSFGPAVLGRVLWDAGFSVGLIAQPDWKSSEDFIRLGKPRLFFAISSGNVDSMVNHYTAARKMRNKDAYSPGGIRKRPDRATIVYTDKLHALYPEVPLVIGGIEASLRRFAHYDYWSDRVRQSVMADAPADLLVYGMGERQMKEIATRLSAGEHIRNLREIPGTSYRMPPKDWNPGENETIIEIPSFHDVTADIHAYARAFVMHSREQDPFRGRCVVQPHPKHIIVQNKPARPLTTREMDHIYELPYQRDAHPVYRLPIPALDPVRFSVVSHRGCFGGCSFCALTHHQGRIIQNRSIASLVREVGKMTKMTGFRGVVQDVGGPTANMFGMHCPKWTGEGTCPDRHCGPGCPDLILSHRKQILLLQRLRAISGVKHVFIGSGVRYDLIPEEERVYLEEICKHHVSGHLKVAPEHIAPRVTRIMNKPGVEEFEYFCRIIDEIKKKQSKKFYILPYFMSGHPACTIEDMIALAEYIRDHDLYTEQVQDFTPTPMTLSTCMYFTGLNPFTMEPVHVPRGREKQVQRAMLHYRDRKNRGLVEEGLRMAGRTDLIGNAWKCLIPGKKKARGDRR
ncbi:MAG TPA: YgiQ family radical SAM protein [Methanoregulaceae archaeon]|nr:YgiQ family radical SAM protein [Methanoregulaceae archaeon]